MKIQCITTPNKDLIVRLFGEMDALGCNKIRDNLEMIATSESKNITLDLSKVEFLDSSGIGVIVFLYKRLKSQKRNLEITGVQGQPQELMKLLRIETAIPVNQAVTNPDSQQTLSQCSA